MICVPTVIAKMRESRRLLEQQPSHCVLATLNRMLFTYAASDPFTGHLAVGFSKFCWAYCRTVYSNIPRPQNSKCLHIHDLW